MESSNILVDANYVYGTFLGAICQLVDQSETFAHTNPAAHHWTFRNNIFIACRAGSIDIPWCVWYNNLFYHCGAGIGTLSFGWLNPTNDNPSGEAYHGEVFANVFIAGQYLSGDDSADLQLYKEATANTIPWMGSASGGWYGGSAVGYTPDPLIDLVGDYNYVARSITNWASVSGGSFTEANGINGGDPSVVNALALNFKPMLGSVLIDAGTNTGRTLDLDWMTAPLGATNDIGPYEFDPNLRMYEWRGREQQRVAIRLGFRNLGVAECGARARLVLDHDLRAEPLAKLLSDDARDDVGRPPGANGTTTRTGRSG